MISALCYLQFHSLKNRLVLRLKRLKQPKYLFGAIVGGLYFYWYFFRVLFVGRGKGVAGMDELTALPAVESVLYESLGALILLVLVLLAWILPRKRAALAFTEAEVAFLFPAPVSRRGLIHFKLARSQLGLLFTALVFSLVSGRLGGSSHWLMHAVAWWLVLFTLNLHFLGASFAVTMLMDRGISTWKRRLAVLGLAVAGLVVVGGWVEQAFPEFTTTHLTDAVSLAHYAQQALVSGPLPYLSYPFRLLVKPGLATDATAFSLALGPALLLMILHYVWVIRSDVAFEEASVEASQKLAEKIAAARAGKMAPTDRKQKSKRPPFRLAPTGAPLVAVLWKNLISAGGAFTARTWTILAALAMALAVSIIGSPRATTWVVVAGTMAGMVSVWILLLGPHILRQDFRQDLPQADMLKVYPLPGWQMALGELLAPAAILTAAQWLLIIVGVACSVTFGREALSPGLALAIGVGAAVLLPMFNLISLVIPNAAVLWFPSWFQTGKDAPQGLEATGQRLIFALGQFLALLVALIPVAGVWVGVFFLMNYVAGAVAAVLGAGLATTLVLALEAGLGVWLLGWLFERFDVSAEQSA